MIGALNIANGFNEFFARVGPELARTFDDVDAEAFEQYLPPHHSAEIFTFCKVMEGMVLEFLGKMQSKCSQGPDGISTKLLKVIIPHILRPLTHCFNLSFQSAFVAPQFCSAHVIPVYNSGKRDNYSNYRPISLLSSMCRLQECIVAHKLMGYLNKHSLLYPLQFGFRGGHCCLHDVLLFLNSLLEGKYDRGGVPKHTIALFLDLKKAFDTVDHVILLRKLENLGAGCKELAWFRHYLQGRKQSVVIDGVTSAEATMSCGVPQGSVLGPL